MGNIIDSTKKPGFIKIYSSSKDEFLGAGPNNSNIKSSSWQVVSILIHIYKMVLAVFFYYLEGIYGFAAWHC